MVKNKINKKQNDFMQLLSPINDNLWRFCLALTYDREDAKELMSETISIAYSSFDNIISKSAFLSFMFTIAKRTFLRNKEKYRRTEYIEPDKFDMFKSNQLSLDTKIEIADLYNALDKLPIEIKEAIVLFDIMGYSRKEVAEIQNTNVENVKSRLYRGRNKLAELLKIDIKEEVYE